MTSPRAARSLEYSGVGGSGPLWSRPPFPSASTSSRRRRTSDSSHSGTWNVAAHFVGDFLLKTRHPGPLVIPGRLSRANSFSINLDAFFAPQDATLTPV